LQLAYDLLADRDCFEVVTVAATTCLLAASTMSMQTLTRRQQRTHTLKCFRVGAQQRCAEVLERLQLQDLLNSEELACLATSVAVHRSDCVMLQQDVHHAAVANLNAKGAMTKSKCTYVQHKLLHQTANKVKHDHRHFVDNSSLPPPPPPPLPEQGFPIQDPAISFGIKSFADLGAMHKVMPFVPFGGHAHTLNADAVEFLPGNDEHGEQLNGADPFDELWGCDSSAVSALDGQDAWLPGELTHSAPACWIDDIARTDMDLLEFLCDKTQTRIFDEPTASMPAMYAVLIDEYYSREVEQKPKDLDCAEALLEFLGNDLRSVSDGPDPVTGAATQPEPIRFDVSDDGDPADESEDIYSTSWSHLAPQTVYDETILPCWSVRMYLALLLSCVVHYIIKVFTPIAANAGGAAKELRAILRNPAWMIYGRVAMNAIGCFGNGLYMTINDQLFFSFRLLLSIGEAIVGTANVRPWLRKCYNYVSAANPTPSQSDDEITIGYIVGIQTQPTPRFNPTRKAKRNRKQRSNSIAETSALSASIVDASTFAKCDPDHGSCVSDDEATVEADTSIGDQAASAGPGDVRWEDCHLLTERDEWIEAKCDSKQKRKHANKVAKRHAAQEEREHEEAVSARIDRLSSVSMSRYSIEMLLEFAIEDNNLIEICALNYMLDIAHLQGGIASAKI
jgi:hypothetical protein